MPIHIKIKNLVWTWNLTTTDLQNCSEDDLKTIAAENKYPPDGIQTLKQIKSYDIDNYYNDPTKDFHPAERNNVLIKFERDTTNPSTNWHIYTDGARNEKGTGAALVVYNGVDNSVVHEEYYKLNSKCTNNQAELWAMYKALVYFTTNNQKLKGSATFFTDSRYVLRIISGSRKSTATGVKVVHLANSLSKRKAVSFCWVPGHQGVGGNERADELAKRAAGSNLETAFNSLPFTYIHNLTYVMATNLWQTEWSSSTTGRLTYLFLPSIVERQKMNYLTPSFNLTQLLTGHGNFPSYLNRIKKRNDDVCNCDGAAIGNAQHILLDCKTYDIERRQLILYCLSNGHAWPPDWKVFCSNKDCFKHLMTFASNCDILKNSLTT
ncbi:uncharacterized protein [Centruroides vittatus]|uniref:uncharacterized protein n=1 Tax=Centruroides vittatus TaxID=120091 RepID=UPI00350F01A4